MADFFKKIVLNIKIVRSKTHVAKYNKLNLKSIPLVAQVNLKKIINQLFFSTILKPPTNVSVGTPLMDSPRLTKQFPKENTL